MMDTISIVLLVAGIALLVAELVLPGGIVMWLGISSILLVGARHYGYVQEIPDLFFAWSALSVGLVSFSVLFLQRFFRGDVESNHFDDIEEALGQEVEVETTVTSQDNSGRVVYQGTAWKAQTEGPDIPAGSKAIVVGRSNITWIVKTHSETEEV
jgi:membrane protein implicated in regulation of membrane protease activity